VVASEPSFAAGVAGDLCVCHGECEQLGAKGIASKFCTDCEALHL
jgi:hypothetical protein